MNRRSFLKLTGATTAAVVLPLPAMAAPKNSVDFPFLTIIQPLSPVVGVLGTKPGQLMNTMTKQVYDSIEFVPCFTEHLYTEWGPRPSEFVGTHLWDSEIVKAATGTSWQLSTPAGNRLVETYYLYGLQVKGDEVVTPCVLSFAGAKIKTYKNLMKILHHWTPSINGLLMDHRPPTFAYKLRISTVLTIFELKKRKVSYYNFKIDPAKGNWRFCWDSQSVDVTNTLLSPDSALFRTAKEFNNQMRKTL